MEAPSSCFKILAAANGLEGSSSDFEGEHEVFVSNKEGGKFNLCYEFTSCCSIVGKRQDYEAHNPRVSDGASYSSKWALVAERSCPEMEDDEGRSSDGRMKTGNRAKHFAVRY
ncbi:predicted protein [Histoplasma capsulatum G186AR]|uniref:Uncharacterized protein n=1 Tax=Ajellomyces capsulatus (strain G186AR / H82 / ATCC MYA-2454 / RMSCC 2432) TaxID=447093 RepID=C0NS75_AJECG|nr:uncharacterized protein HCBG_06005 [Histoplasma capsulatum G186AR]EEH05741.1 predicted protein [Histoplasma capsulatum G186AR]